jgi:hypothetical protein
MIQVTATMRILVAIEPVDLSSPCLKSQNM